VLDHEVDGTFKLPATLPSNVLPGLTDCQLLSAVETGQVILRTRWVDRQAGDSQWPVLRRALSKTPAGSGQRYIELQTAQPVKKRTRFKDGLVWFLDWAPKVGSAIGVLAVAYIWLYARIFASPNVQLYSLDSSLSTVAPEKVAFRLSLRNSDKDAPVTLVLSTQIDKTLSAGLTLDSDPRLGTIVLNPSETRDIAVNGRTARGFGGTGSVAFSFTATGGLIPRSRTSTVTVPLRIWKPSEARLAETAAKKRDCLLTYDLHFGVSTASGWSAQLMLTFPGAKVSFVEPFTARISDTATLASFTVTETRPMTTHRLYLGVVATDPSTPLDCRQIPESVEISFEKRL
jgi:hypothetical protein